MLRRASGGCGHVGGRRRGPCLHAAPRCGSAAVGGDAVRRSGDRWRWPGARRASRSPRPMRRGPSGRRPSARRGARIGGEVDGRPCSAPSSRRASRSRPATARAGRRGRSASKETRRARCGGPRGRRAAAGGGRRRRRGGCGGGAEVEAIVGIVPTTVAAGADVGDRLASAAATSRRPPLTRLAAEAGDRVGARHEHLAQLARR